MTLARCADCRRYLKLESDTYQSFSGSGVLCDDCRLTEAAPVKKLSSGYFAFVAVSGGQISGPWASEKAALAAHRQEWGRAWFLEAKGGRR